MTAVDDIVAAINGVKDQYEQAQQALSEVIESTDTTAVNLANLGAERSAELLVGAKEQLSAVTRQSGELIKSLEEAATAAEDAKG